MYNGDKWVSLIKQTGEFLAPNTRKHAFGRLNAMETFLDIEESSPVLGRYFKPTTKLKREWPTDTWTENIPIIKILSSAEDIHGKTGEVLQNSYLYM